MLALSQIDILIDILISLQPIFHISVMRIWQKRNTFQCKNVIPHVRSATKWIIPCSDWCELDCWIQKLMTPGHTFLDSTIRFEYPGMLSKEKSLRRWGVSETHGYCRQGRCHLTTPHSTRTFSAPVKEDKMGDLLSDAWRKLFSCMPQAKPLC